MGMDFKCVHVGRRDFIKTGTLAGMAATLPVAGLAAQEMRGTLKPSPQGRKRRLVFLTDTPPAYEKIVESIRFIKEYDIDVTPIVFNPQKIQEAGNSIREIKDADILFIILPRVTNRSGHIPAALGDLDIPIDRNGIVRDKGDGGVGNLAGGIGAVSYTRIGKNACGEDIGCGNALIQDVISSGAGFQGIDPAKARDLRVADVRKDNAYRRGCVNSSAKGNRKGLARSSNRRPVVAGYILGL